MENNTAQGGNGRGKYFYIAIAFLAIVLLCAFWWYSWRPTKIKKECFADNGWTIEYNKCLMKQGLDSLPQ